MNREGKRKLIKKLQSEGCSEAEILKLIEIQEIAASKKFLKEGDRVKLNINNIKSHVDYDKLTNEYKQWVNTHKADIFTVEYDKKFKENPSIICLKEDATEPKWLFHEKDLNRIEAKN